MAEVHKFNTSKFNTSKYKLNSLHTMISVLNRHLWQAGAKFSIIKDKA